MRREIAIGNEGSTLVTNFNENFKDVPIHERFFNVCDYGAVHDNETDDTASIQAAINACAAAGGGTVFFPNGIYLLSGALQNGIACHTWTVDYNSQLYIPNVWWGTGGNGNYPVIKLSGETPINYVMYYKAGEQEDTVILKSTIAGTGTTPSVLCSKGPIITETQRFNYINLVIENITILVNPFVDTTGPSMSGVNVVYSNHTEIKGLMCALDIDWSALNTTIEPENHVFGLAISAANADFPVIDFYDCYGFYYGLIIWEGVHVKDVFCHHNYIGIMQMSSFAGSVVDFAVLHWNAYDIASQQETLFGKTVSRCNLIIRHLISEDSYTGHQMGAAWTMRIDEILDSDNNLVGSINYICAGNLDFAGGGYIVKSHGGYNFLAKNIYTHSSYHWTTAERPIIKGAGTTGFNITTGKLECWDGSIWNDLY